MGNQITKNTSSIKPKLLEQVRAKIRVKHYSRRTEEAYTNWIKRYILFHKKKHPEDMGEEEISDFLSHLAVDGNVSASTQNQAMCAIVFLYKQVMEKVKMQHQKDLEKGFGTVYMPYALAKKYPNANREWG